MNGERSREKEERRRDEEERRRDEEERRRDEERFEELRLRPGSAPLPPMPTHRPDSFIPVIERLKPEVSSRTVQDSAGQCRTVQDSAGQCRTVQDSAGQCRTVQDSAGQCRTV